MRKYSIIIPVYNRPGEIKELLESLKLQEKQPHEIIVVDDGSTTKCESTVSIFGTELPVKYYYKENSGQGFSRNFGFEKATGDYFIIFDSDCIIPPGYLQNVDKAIEKYGYDLFGGPDGARDDFTNVQKAINYSMTSIFTTGGIRGSKKHAGIFHPRSFNMGLSREVFQRVGGFKITRMGEDIEYSVRIINAGFKSGLIADAVVYHKRRTSFTQFFAQLRFFGRARINVSRFFPKELKVLHLFPLFFLLGQLIWIGITPFVSDDMFKLGILVNALFIVLIFVDSTLRNRNLIVSVLSVVAAYTQLLAYGTGLLTEGLKKTLGK